jgi:hypothetical protein
VMAAHPGVAHTSLFVRKLREEGAGWLVPVARPVMALALASPEAGARSVLRAVGDQELATGSFVGPGRLGQTRGRPELLDVYPNCQDPLAAAALWRVTEQLLGQALPFSGDTD